MRILVPLPFDIASLQHGRNLRVVHLLCELGRRCEITCAAADERLADAAKSVLPGINVVAAPERPEPRRTWTTVLYGSWLTRRAVDFFGYDPAMHAWIDRLSGQADAVLGFDLPSAMYLAQLGRVTGRLVPAICDLIDDPWLTYRNGRIGERWSPRGLKTAVAVRVLRRRLLSMLDMLVAVAPADAESLLRATGRPVRVVPNGVGIPTAATELRGGRGGREMLVVFTGAMSFPPNEQAARYLVHAIWPRVRRAIPNAKLALVGADAGPRVKALAGEDGVTVTGRVSDVGDWLRRACVAVAPMLSGSGMKNKVLEACANACPVVATSKAAAGIPAGPSNGILIADAPVSFAVQIIQLLADMDAAKKLGRAGQDMVRDRFTWARAAEALESTLCACVDAYNHSRGRPNSEPLAKAGIRLVEPPLTAKEVLHAGS